jgi:hypothetical protein
MPPIRITLQNLKPELHTIGYPLHQHDAPIAGTGVSPPPEVLLDFMYGVAAYRRWGSGHDISEVMQHRSTECHKSIPIPPASPVSSDGVSSPESHDSNDDYGPVRRRRGRNHMSDGMLRAMDNVLILSMLVKGTTPELMAAERQARGRGRAARGEG